MINKKSTSFFLSITALGLLSMGIFLSSIIPQDSLAQQSIEIGKNYNIEFLGDRTFKWTSHNERIFDGNSWINYKFTDESTQLVFESASTSFILDKNTCNFKFFEGGFISRNVINNYSIEIYKDDVKSLSNCTINEITENPEDVIIQLNNNGVDTKIILDMLKTEWFYDLQNNEGRETTYRIVETCPNCTPDRIENNILYFGDYYLDTKNEQHNTLKQIDTRTNDIKIEYEKVLQDKETFKIDPTFSSSNPTEDGSVMDIDNDDVCEASPSSVGSDDLQMETGRYASVFAEDCSRAFAEYDISSIPDLAIIDDTVFKFEVSAGQGFTNCDYTGITGGQPSVDTDANNWANIGSGSSLVTNDSQCSSIAINKSVDLTAAGDTYITGQLASDWAAIGILGNGDIGALDASYHYDAICWEESACTPDPTLEITYRVGTVWNAGPPINPSATNSLVNQINFTFTPDNATGVIGYTIWNSSTNSANDWEWNDLAVTANFTDSDDFGFYLHTGFTTECTPMYYKASAISLDNGTNSTVVQGATDGCQIIISQNIYNIGDTFKVNGTIALGDVNITSITLSENGTITDTNSTGQNSTGTVTINFEFWERDEVGGPRNLTTTVYAQDPLWVTINNESKGVGTREYESDYKTAVVPSQGSYNYTESRINSGQTSFLKVNRINVPSGETWPLECNYKDELFDAGTWFNTSSDQGFFNLTAGVPTTRNSYVTCYNDDVVFTLTSFGNKNATLAIVDFSEQLGTFAGVPLPFLFIILLASIFTGRSAVTGIIFIAITIGTMGVMGFLPDVNGDPAISGIVWSMIVFLTAIGVFMGKRYF